MTTEELAKKIRSTYLSPIEQKFYGHDSPGYQWLSVARFVQAEVIKGKIEILKEYCDIKDCDFDHVHERINELKKELQILTS